MSTTSGKADEQIKKQLDHQAEAAKKIGLALASVFSVQKIGAAVERVTGQTSRIADAASRLGVSAEAVQRLGFAASQSGSSLEAVGVAMGAMADVLGSKDADAKLEKIGLSLDKIKGLTPDQTFFAMADGLRGIEDPLKQADYMTDLWGRGSLQLLPAVKAGFADVGDQAHVMTNETVEAGDKAGDALDKMRGKMDALMAQALVPLLGAFTALPESVQIGVAGIFSFFPSLEALALAIIAAGGPVAALGILKAAALGVGTFFTATLPGMFTTIIAFFTTTLPAAFGTALAFLGPQGLIALAVLAVVTVWYFFGDEIAAVVSKVYGVVKEWLIDKLGGLWGTLKEKLAAVGGWFGEMKNKAVSFAKQTYEGVKAWLVDKFAAVVKWIGEKVGQVTGFFRDMYDKVVGNSYVPDMVTEIGQEFGRLDSLMVKPAVTSTGRVESAFRSMSDKVRSLITGLVSDISQSLSTWADKFLPTWAANVVGRVAEIAIGAVVDGMMSKFGMGGDDRRSGSNDGGWSGGGGGSNGGQYSAMDQIKGGLIDFAFKYGEKAITAIANKLRGGEEGMYVNPARDVFIRQFGPPGTGDGSGFMNLAALLTQITGQDGGGNLFAWMAEADTLQSLRAAAEAIVATLTAAGQPATVNFNEGTKGRYLDFGTGTPVMLHGKERVMTEAEGRAEASGGGVTLNVEAGAIVVHGAGKNPDQIAGEIIPALMKRIGRYNQAGSRGKMARGGLRPAWGT
jgi:hypothetical protein